MASQLVEFLEGRKEKAHGVDWEQKKLDWLNAVALLYNKIGVLLGGTIDKGIVKAEKFEVEVHEDFIGTYPIDELRLTVGDDRVTFKPVGINVIGALGRVDMRGDRDKIPLIWTEGAGEWQFLLQRVPDLVMIPLEEDSLLAALKRVMAP
jgi:hypothetical protein